MDRLSKLQQFVDTLDGIADSVVVAYLKLTDGPERAMTAGDMRVLLAALRQQELARKRADNRRRLAQRRAVQ